MATRHYVPRAWPFAFTNGIQASYLEVDTDTGFVKLLKHWCVEDCGTIINPQLVDEQIRGGVVQGIGAALFEQCLYDERGQMLNGNMADYLVPMAVEMPDIDCGHVVSPTANSELGAKGAGEAGTAGAPACVMNAINDALRPFGAAPLTDMPFTPGKILRALGRIKRCGIHPRLKEHQSALMRRCNAVVGERALLPEYRAARNRQEGNTSMNIKVGKEAIAEASKKLSNWGRWGKDDHIGTLNHVTPEDIVNAAKLIRTGKVFALGIPLDRTGPQTGLFGGRFNPIHQMLATGTDAIAGRQDWNKIRYADDTLMLCVQGATHWDALGHIFYEDKAYNGHDAKLIDCARPLGARHRAFQEQDDRPRRAARHRALSRREVDAGRRKHFQRRTRQMRQAQNVTIGRGDFVIVRTGQMERCLAEKRMGRLCRRRRAGREIRELLLVPGQSKSPRSAPTPGASRCGRTKPRKPTSPGIGW